MSALIGHAKAARIMCQALATKAQELNRAGFESEALIIVSLADAHHEAAKLMDEEVRRETAGRGGDLDRP